MSYLAKMFNTPFFQNKFVLYGSLFLVLLSILRHIANGNVNAVVLMALIGLVMSYFSKNMIIVLLTAFATVFVLETVGYQGVMEGMETKKKEDKGDEEDTAENADDDKDNDKEKDKKNEDNKSNNNEEKGTEKEKKGTKTQNNLSSQKDPAKKNKQGMTSLSPASYDGKEDDGEGAHGLKEANRIDYASTLEQAYDNIENIIGEEGVRGLTDQTKSLMHQQKELMNNMKEMGPLLKSAEGFMHQITGNGGISGITDMLKGFATPGGNK
jgi:hypothetical protein